MDDPAVHAVAAEICAVGRSLFERGYVHATAGNISAPLPDGGHLITPTDACLGRLEPDDIVRVDATGAAVAGRPSKTLALHRRIYAEVPEAGCILHTHSTELVRLTLRPGEPFSDLLPPITPYFVMKVGHVPRLPYRAPGHPGVADDLAAALHRYAESGHTLRAVVLERLGPVVWGPTPLHAQAVLEELEETAALYGAGAVPPLRPAALAELAERFGVRW